MASDLFLSFCCSRLATALAIRRVALFGRPGVLERAAVIAFLIKDLGHQEMAS